MNDAELLGHIRAAREKLWEPKNRDEYKLIRRVEGMLRFECPDCDFTFGSVSGGVIDLYGLEEHGVAHLLEHDPEIRSLLRLTCPKCGEKLDHPRPFVGICEFCEVDVNMLEEK